MDSDDELRRAATPVPESGLSERLTPDLLALARQGHEAAERQVFALVYDELRCIAEAQFRKLPVREMLQPTALVHEAFLRLVGRHRLDCKDRQHVVAVAARAMHDILVEHLRRGLTQRRGGTHRRVELPDRPESVSMSAEDILDLDRALSELEALYERQAHVVVLRFLAGFTHQEVAGILGLTYAQARQDWDFARAWLNRRLSSREPPLQE